MLACIKKQMSMAGGEDKIMELSCSMPGHLVFDDDDHGTTLDNVKKTLAKLSVKVSSSDSSTKKSTGVKISPGKCWNLAPALALVGWYTKVNGKLKRTGGHYVVARWFTDDCSKVVYLDPYDGELIERVNDGWFASSAGSGPIKAVLYT